MKKKIITKTFLIVLILGMIIPLTKIHANPLPILEEDLNKYSLQNITGPTRADFVVVGNYDTFDEAVQKMNEHANNDNMVIRNNASRSPLKIVAAVKAKAMSYPFRTGIESATVTMNIKMNRDLYSLNANYQDTYINGYRLLDYFGTHYSTARKGYVAHVNISGNTGYVDQNKIDIIPTIFIDNNWSIPLGGNTGTSSFPYSSFNRVVKDHFYTATLVNGRKEISYNYPNLSSTAVYKTVYGIAPDWMNPGVRYYSTDGITFYTDNAFQNLASETPYYNYYQYLPVHSKSFVTAQFLDNYIKNVRKVSSTSVMLNLGYAFMNGQVRYDMNALLLYSLAAVESGWGTSAIARNKYNLFGWGAVDTSPGQSATEYLTPAQSVDQQMKHNLEAYTHLSTNAVGNHFRGPYFGNKGNGFNLKYASDPFWGLTMSGIAFQLDKANGFKDWGNYQLGILKDNTNVPIQKNLNSTDTYFVTPGQDRKLSHQSIIIVPDPITEAKGFYKVKLTTPMERYLASGKYYYRPQYDWENTFGYVAQDYVNTIAYRSGKSINPVDPALVNDPVITPEVPETPIVSDASKQGVYKITASAGLRLRDRASTNSNILLTIPFNAQVVGLPYNDGWHAVTYNGRSGFVSSDWIEEVKAPVTIKYESTGSGLNVRREPTTSSDSLGTLNVGDIIEGVAYDAHWTWFMYKNSPAYVSSQYLKIASQTPVIVVDKKELKSVIDAAQNIKATDYTSESYKAFETVLNEAKVVYNNVNATQDQVNAQVSKLNEALNNLVLKEVEPVVPLDKYRITATNGLRVRSTPSTSGVNLGLLAHNTIVEAKPVGDGSWLEISYNEKPGYIFAQYTEKISPTSVKLGDINGDGKISTIDFVIYQRHFLGIENIPTSKIVAADLNKDGKLSTIDFVIMQRHFLGIELLP